MKSIYILVQFHECGANIRHVKPRYVSLSERLRLNSPGMWYVGAYREHRCSEFVYVKDLPNAHVHERKTRTASVIHVSRKDRQ